VVDNIQLILQEEIIFEKRKIRRDCEVSLTEMHKNGDLKNGIGIQMDEFDLEMMDLAVEEVTTGEPGSPLKEGLGYHKLIGIWGGDLLTLCRPPLENDTGREEMVGYQLKDLVLINGGGFEQLRA
jgi:hypothetical protein